MSDTPPAAASPSVVPPPNAARQPVEIKVDLKNPLLAGILAWLVPGAGHFYQGRWAKGALFCVCILGTFLFGLVLGEGKVVHSGGLEHVSGRGLARLVQTWPIIPQSCVGLAASPAWIQHLRLLQKKQPLFGGFMAPPDSAEELSYWYEQLNVRYDVGALYTIVAGLLNVLAIYDAACGPVILEEEDKDKDKDKDKARDDKTKKKGAK